MAAEPGDPITSTIAQTALPSGLEVIPLLWWSAWFVFSWIAIAALWRRGVSIRLGVFIGLVAVTALLASLYIPDTPVLRAIVGMIGSSFLVGEIFVIYREGSRRDTEVREDRALHDERSMRIMTAFTEFQDAFRTDADVRTGALQAVLDAVTTIAASDRASLRQETWRLMTRLSGISADFHRTKLAIEQQPMPTSSPALTAQGAYGAPWRIW